MPMASLRVVGKWSEEARKQIPLHDQIHFFGYVEDLTAALKGKVMIVPLQVGSGIRTKILAAWAAACPVVTTSVGVEGLPGSSGEHYLAADDIEGFAAACQILATDAAVYRRIATAGHRLVQDQYSLAAVKNRRVEIYEEQISRQRTEAE
mgnify:CR=1 FL=1